MNTIFSSILFSHFRDTTLYYITSNNGKQRRIMKASKCVQTVFVPVYRIILGNK